MIGYVTIGVKDMDKGKAFWTELLEPLGAKMLMDMERIKFYGTGEGTMVAICVPYDENAQNSGNGNMRSFGLGVVIGVAPSCGFKVQHTLGSTLACAASRFSLPFVFRILFEIQP